MYFAKRAALVSVAAIAASLTFSSIANATDAKVGDCIHLAKQVAEAMSTAQPGQVTDTAREQANAGRSFCASSLYVQGVAHYNKALQLLGKS